MDLSPFMIINPCGHRGLEVTDLKALGKNTEIESVVDDIKAILEKIKQPSLRILVTLWQIKTDL